MKKVIGVLVMSGVLVLPVVAADPEGFVMWRAEDIFFAATTP